MTITGIKLVCERKDGLITTWGDVLFNKSVKEVIEEVKYKKHWIGGKFLKIYIEYNENGIYQKMYLDIKKNEYNKCLTK